MPPAARTRAIGKNAGFIGFLSAGPYEPDRLVALKQVKANARGLTARSREAAIAIEEQLRIALRDRSELRDVVRCRDAECLFSGLASAQDFAGTAQSQILLGDPK